MNMITNAPVRTICYAGMHPDQFRLRWKRAGAVFLRDEISHGWMAK